MFCVRVKFHCSAHKNEQVNFAKPPIELLLFVLFEAQRFALGILQCVFPGIQFVPLVTLSNLIQCVSTCTVLPVVILRLVIYNEKNTCVYMSYFQAGGMQKYRQRHTNVLELTTVCTYNLMSVRILTMGNVMSVRLHEAYKCICVERERER